MVRKLELAEKWNCFKKLKNQVKSIWVEGNLEEHELSNCVAIVGSRKATQYGRQVIEKLVSHLVGAQKIIISGFMYGTDQAVHRSVIDLGGKTIAVLGWGIGYKNLDDDDQKLWRNIVNSGGVILSEWEKQSPAFWTFPARDRIMAAMATDVFVVEAAVKSGALITADIARELGKQVWAVPGSVFSSVSVGTNKLIAEGKAKMWLPIQQLTINLNLKMRPNDTNILSLLQNELLTADEVAKILGKPIAEVLQELMILTLEGKVVEGDGKYKLV